MTSMRGRGFRRCGSAIATGCLVWVAACGSKAADAPQGTAAVSSDLLGARVDPGLGLGPSVPVAGTPEGMSRRDQGLAPVGGPAVDLSELGFEIGSQDAPIRIVEFSDFGCGYCRKFHLEVYPTLERDYVATGKVLWKYVPMVLGIFGPNSEWAARAGECAGEQGNFADMRDRLFGAQGEWKRADEPMVHFRRYATELGLDVDRFGRCVDEGWRDARIVNGTDLSRQVGVRGTPTFFIVGYAPIPGALPLDLFEQVLDTVYAERMRAGR